MPRYSELQPTLLILTDATTGELRQIRLNNDLFLFEKIDNTLLRYLSSYKQDTIANRPAAGVIGRIFYATDEKNYYGDDGSAWHLIRTKPNAYIQDTIANRPAAGVSGRIFYATDEDGYYGDDGSVWHRIYPENQDYVTGYLSADQTIDASSTIDIIAFDTVIDDSNSLFDTINHNATIKNAGFYLLTLCIQMKDGATSSVVVTYFYKNGSELYAAIRKHVDAYSLGLQLSMVINLAVNDVIDFRIMQTDSASHTLVGGSNTTYFSISRIR